MNTFRLDFINDTPGSGESVTNAYTILSKNAYLRKKSWDLGILVFWVFCIF